MLHSIKSKDAQRWTLGVFLYFNPKHSPGYGREPPEEKQALRNQTKGPLWLIYRMTYM